MISSLLGEILLCLKDSKVKTREAASSLLISISRDIGVVALSHGIAAAIASETSHMRSAAVIALSKVVIEYGQSSECLMNMMPSLLQTVLLLSADPSREVSKSVIVFLRVSISVCPTEMIRSFLPSILEASIAYHKGKDRFRGKIKLTMKKMIRVFGSECLIPLVTGSESHMVNYIKKLAKEVTKPKKRRNHRFREKSVDEMMDSDEEDSDGADSDTESNIVAVRKARVLQTNSRKRGNNEGLHYSTGKEGRILVRRDDSGGLEATELGIMVDRDGDQSDSDDDAGIAFDSQGRLIITAMRNSGDHQKAKNSSDNIISDSDARITEKNVRVNRVQGRALGDAYKSNKSGGDVKRKGQKLDPYAYVPLDGKSYTKKNRSRAVEQFGTVIRGRKRQRR